VKPYISTSLAGVVLLRAGKRCEYCHAPQQLTGQAFHFDHIIPVSIGGKTTAENLCLACSHCNIAKSNRTKEVDPKTGKQVRLFNPRSDDWKKHFRWSANWTRINGRTAIGRATVVALKMNDELLQEARPFWRSAGKLP
jgi:hypothetical protein